MIPPLTSFLLLAFLGGTTNAVSCLDDDVGLAQLAAANDLSATGCVDAMDSCGTKSVQGGLVRSLCCETCGGEESGGDSYYCVDASNQAVSRVVELSRAAPQQSEPSSSSQLPIRSCSDAAPLCAMDDVRGRLARGLCCATCSSGSGVAPVAGPSFPPVESVLPPSVDDGSTLQLFLLGGQSECSGSGSATDLASDSVTYPELQDDALEGIWYAGYPRRSKSTETFFIAPLTAGVARSTFGPELSFAQRVNAVTGERVMMVKHCVGGTNVRAHWNPDTETNSWDRQRDDGTAEWLASNANLVFVPHRASKPYQYINTVYTIRRTQEALDAANIPYEWAGIVWVQGAGDDDQDDPVLWKTFGENTANVWNGLREAIGTDAPIVDTGAATKNQLRSGKHYATQIVKGCRAKAVEYAMGADDDTSTDCVVSASNSCFGSPNRVLNLAVFDHYGYDPLSPPGILPPMMNETKTFHWWVQFPTNLHSAYEGMILKGRMLANEYLRTFTEHRDNLDGFERDDPTVLFPYEPCPESVLPREGALCWIDYRDEALVADGLLCEDSHVATNESSRKEIATENTAGDGESVDRGGESSEPMAASSGGKNPAATASLVWLVVFFSTAATFV